MKTKIILIVFMSLLFVLKGEAQSSSKSLELSDKQLQKIGFVINDKGVFFKTILPKGDYQAKEAHSFNMRGFFNGVDNYGATIGDADPVRDSIISPEDKQTDIEFKKLKPIEVDYYIICISDLKGKQYFSFHKSDVEVLPILLKQEKYNFMDKKDIVIYIMYTDQLKGKLGDIENIEDYKFTYRK